MAERFLNLATTKGAVFHSHQLAPDQVPVLEGGPDVFVVRVLEDAPADGFAGEDSGSTGSETEDRRAIGVETFKGEGPQPYFWRLVAANGETIAASEGYKRKGDRDDTAALVADGLGVEATEV